ncbi:dienelactone hydrolase family protein [Thermomonas brevis]
MRRALVALGLLLAVTPALAAMQTKPVEWSVGQERFSGYLVYDDEVDDDELRPGLVMFPNWMGVTELALERAREVADDDYVVLVADVYGKDLRPKDAKEAGAAVGKVYDDGGLRLRERANAAVAALKAQAGKAPLDAARIGAFGFCFGGSVALELARSGAEVAGVVSFHGGLERHRPGADTYPASVLVLNGADDTAVPEEHILAFRREMKAAKADWQFVDLGNAVHCFTQEESKSPPNCVYDERASNRAFEMMEDFFDERFDD